MVYMNSDTITILRDENQLIKENKVLRNSDLYKRSLEFKNNIKTKKYTIEELGF